MGDKVVIQKEDFPEWLKESEFYLDLEEGEFEVEKWMLLDGPSFDTVENIMHFLRIVNFVDINIEPYVPKIRDFMKDDVNYFSLISYLSSKNYGVYKELLEEFEGPLFRIDVEGSICIDEGDGDVFGYLDFTLKITIKHRNMCFSFNLQGEVEYNIGEKEKTQEDLINGFIEEFTVVGDLLSNKLDDKILLLKEWTNFKMEMKNKLERQEYLNLLKAYKKDHEIDKIPPSLKLDEKNKIIKVELTDSHHDCSYNNVFFLKDEEKGRIGFFIEPPSKSEKVDTNVIFLKIRDLDVVKNEFYSVKDKILKLVKKKN
jgi:hypothetical protein